MNLAKDMTVADIVIQNPLTARVFHEKGIDFCCGGKLPLDEVCEKKNLKSSDILALLHNIEKGHLDFKVTESTRATEVIDHILTRFHQTLQQELPTVAFLMDKVARVHGAYHPHLKDLQSLFLDLVTDLDPHILKEEKILFPMIKELDLCDKMQRPAGQFHCGSVESPISQMEVEHHEVGAILAKMRDITDGYTLPQGACNSFRGLYAGLEKLEYDTHLHIHMENNVLHPMAVELESKIGVQGKSG